MLAPTPHPLPFDWMFRTGAGSAGYRTLAVWDPASRESFVTDAFTVLDVDRSAERRRVGTGALEDRRRQARAVVAVHGRGEVRRLERWAEAGTPVCARLVAAGRSRHLLWDDPVPVHLDPYRGGLGGVALVLHSERFEAAVREDVDLMGQLTFAEGDWTATGDVTWGTGLDEDPGTFVQLGVSGAEVVADVPLPLGGQRLALTFDAVNFGQPGEIGVTVEYGYRNAAQFGTAMGGYASGDQTPDAPTDWQTHLYPFDLPANAYGLRIRFGLDAPGFVQVSSPRLVTRTPLYGRALPGTREVPHYTRP